MEIEYLLFNEMERFYMALVNNTAHRQGHPLEVFYLETNLRIDKKKSFCQLQDL